MGALLAALAGSAAAQAISGIMGSSAATKAAGLQSQAAQYSANLQNQATQKALGIEQQQWQAQQAELSPYLNAGYGALAQLEGGMGIPVTAPTLAGLSPTNASTPAALTPQANANNPKYQQAQKTGATLKQLGLSGNETAPLMGLGVSNNSQAVFNQGFMSAADDINHAVAAGYLTPAQGQAAVNNLMQQLNLYGGPAQYGNAANAFSQTQSGLQSVLGAINSGQHVWNGPKGSSLQSVYIPANAPGWEGNSPGTGASLANWAIVQALQAAQGAQQNSTNNG
jgi:hypothetical protein